MKEILFLAHRIPFPPDRGDKIRSHQILHRLARTASVHVATFADDDYDMVEEAELAAIARSYKLVRRAKPIALAGLQALVTRKPVSLTAFHDRAIAAYVDDLLARRSISTIYVYSGQMGQYVPKRFRGRVVVDFVDVDSAKFEAYANLHGGVIGRIEAREARLLRREEARLALRADTSLLVTAQEAELFRLRLSSGDRARADVRVLGNGVDSQSLDPGVVAPELRILDCPGPRLIFTGQMDYLPNVDAALRVMDRILPLIRQELPEATFHVVGRNPASELLDRDGQEGIHVWGRVNDMRPWLKSADLALIPLEIARGVQNKVLEAMSMALPVVLSEAAAMGIGARDGEHYDIGESDQDFAAAAIALLREPGRARDMGAAARRFVIENFSWQAALEPLTEIVALQGRAVRDAE